MGRPPLHRNALTFRPTPTIKFLCSYGGKILPRYPDGKLRYHGGETRLLSVNRSISFSGLSAPKDFQGWTRRLKLR
uniref:Uncharacterized protein n=1 Tax=Cucumis melo TaxID=3656 RepID=A0A9I9CZ88_CUCME